VHPRLERRCDVGHVELALGDVDDDRDDVVIVNVDHVAIGLIEDRRGRPGGALVAVNERVVARKAVQQRGGLLVDRLLDHPPAGTMPQAPPFGAPVSRLPPQFAESSPSLHIWAIAVWWTTHRTCLGAKPKRTAAQGIAHVRDTRDPRLNHSSRVTCSHAVREGVGRT